MRIGLLGGLTVEHDGRAVAVTGTMQLAVLFRLAVDAGAAVSYRAISEDVWGADVPENTRGALQSIVSRLRSQLPYGSIESTAGGYRLAVARADVDALAFTDLVAAADSSDRGAQLASDALGLWAGEPWIPSDSFDWFVRDLVRDHARALELGGTPPNRQNPPNLPLQLTSLVGRETELATIAEQLASNRLVTIIGTGGAGKTRLALEAAARRKNALLVELAPVGPTEVLGAVLTATGREIRTAEGGSEIVGSRERVLDALGGRDLLLVLDNCEHVIDVAAALAQDLLSALPLLRILATSREPLGVPGEAFVGVGSLRHPTDAQIETLSTGDLHAFAAIELFAQRALSARGRGLEDTDIADAARICTRLDGLPLAIELAAAKLRTMALDEVLTGLDDRFTLLTGGYRTALPRHQTLKAMIDWSWSLLSEDERTALLHFAVFPAGLAASEARAFASDLGISDAAVFDLLVDRSLLQRVRGRFRALETVREYGIDRLSVEGFLADALAAQAQFMTRRAREMDGLLRGPRIVEAIAWFDAEEDNLASALRYASGAPRPDLAVSLVVACIWYWIIRDRNDEAQSWFGLVAPLAELAEGTEAGVLAVVGRVLLALSAGDAAQMGRMDQRLADDVKELLGALRQLEVKHGDHDLVQLVLPIAGAFSDVLGAGEWMTALRIPDPVSLDLDPWPTALLLVARAAMAQNRGLLAELGSASALALEKYNDIGDLWGIALSEQMRAIWLSIVGRLEEALELSDSSTAHMRNITTNWDLAQQQGLAIQMLMRLGRVPEALERIRKMLEEAEEGGSGRAVLQANLTAATLSLQLGDVDTATERLRAVESARDSWHREPAQITGMVEGLHGSMAIRRGDLDAAENYLRLATDASVRSMDQPVIGGLAITVGTYLLARGNVELAVRAVDFATAMIGAYDATNPEVIAIAEAAHRQGIGRPGTEVPERPIAFAALKELLA
jgi:predicted ATPase/tetratricopeptide (TPR) repeat protein